MRTEGIVRLGGLVLDLDGGTLRDQAGRDTPIRPKSLGLLRHLARRSGEIVSKAELLDAIWPGINVTEDSLFQCVRDIRRALQDTEGLILRTVPKRGYLLAAHPAGFLRSGAADHRDEPCLAVLPFTVIADHRAEQIHAEGLVSEMLAGLGRIPWLRLSASGPRTAAAPSDTARTPTRPDARYVLAGSVERSGRRVRVHCHLEEAATRRRLWSGHFDGRPGDPFGLQDQLRENLVGAMEPALRAAELARAKAKPAGQLDAHDLLLQAVALHLSNERWRMREAQVLLARAAELDPEYARPRAFSALTTVIQTNQGWSVKEEREAGVRSAMEALGLAPDDPVVLRCVGHALTYLAHEHVLGRLLVSRAIELRPDSPEAHHSAGWVMTFGCDGPAAMPHFERALRLGPLDAERGHTLVGRAFALLQADLPEAALTSSQSAMIAVPKSISPLRAAIFALSRLGRPREAWEVARALLRLDPDFRVGAFAEVQPFRDPGFAGQYLDSLCRAGLPP